MRHRISPEAIIGGGCPDTSKAGAEHNGCTTFTSAAPAEKHMQAVAGRSGVAIRTQIGAAIPLIGADGGRWSLFR